MVSYNTVDSNLIWLSCCYVIDMKKYFAPLLFVIFISCNQGTSHQQGNGNADTVDLTDMGTSTDSSALKGNTSGSHTADTSQQKTETQSSDPVAWIRQKVEHINTAGLESKHFEFMCDEKMKVDYFYEQGEIKKISIDFGTIGDVYAKEDYYYDEGKLIFFYEFVEGGPACEGCIQKNEYRSYIKNDKVFKHLKDKDQAKCRKCEFPKTSKPYKLLTAKNTEQIKLIMCGLR